MVRRTRRKKRRTTRKRRKTVKPAPVKRRAFTSTQRHVNPVTEVHVLGIAGGIVTLLAGILWLLGSLFSWSLEAFTWFSFGDLGLINIACGLILLLSAATLKKNFLGVGLVLLIFSIIAIIAPPGGFVVGPILGLIGGIIALVKSANPSFR
ncbi:MAG: hypothetical protein JSW08_04070 [archaeon]|nr:MAG: hypothetical protein JSW08_04070 [archaeon]